MKKNSKKLLLSRETVSTLSGEELRQVNGGTILAIDKYALIRGSLTRPTWGVFTCGYECMPQSF